MKLNKETYFSVGELEWIQELIEVYGAGPIDARNRVIRYKREQALMYRQQGNDALADQLLDELGELDLSRQGKDLPTSTKHFKKLILPGDNPIASPDDEKVIIVVK